MIVSARRGSTGGRFFVCSFCRAVEHHISTPGTRVCRCGVKFKYNYHSTAGVDRSRIHLLVERVDVD